MLIGLNSSFGFLRGVSRDSAADSSPFLPFVSFLDFSRCCRNSVLYSADMVSSESGKKIELWGWLNEYCSLAFVVCSIRINAGR